MSRKQQTLRNKVVLGIRQYIKAYLKINLPSNILLKYCYYCSKYVFHRDIVFKGILIQYRYQKTSILARFQSRLKEIMFFHTQDNIAMISYPAWSSGQDSWLSPSRPGFDSRCRKPHFCRSCFKNQFDIHSNFSSYSYCQYWTNYKSK